MIRLYYSAGAARIVEIQLNSLSIPKSTDNPTVQSATSVSRVELGSDAIKTPIKPSEELQIKNLGD